MPESWLINRIPWPKRPVAAVSAFAGEWELAWLDSETCDAGRPRGPAARYSMICTEPVAVLEQYDHQPARLFLAGKPVAWAEDVWSVWRQAQQQLVRLPPAPWRVSPGWVGYLGFELARQLERLPASHNEDLGLPLARLSLFDRAVVLDHREHRAFSVHAPGVCSALSARAPASRDWLLRWCQAAACTDLAEAGTVRLVRQMSQPAHQQMVSRALEYIAAGDIYQVNLAQRLGLYLSDDPLTTYAAARRLNPAPYAALLRWDRGAVASFSPELFLRLRGDAVLTRPIKGTRPRTNDLARDEILLRELLASEKEAAELAMIIDLHRNDLGRVCQYGSVRVAHARRVEAHPSVFHTVADVVGRLAPGRDGIDLLMACFPAGSVTGVPKVRALEIIDELEPVARGVYTGAVGALGLDGQMTFNVAIRTMQICGPAATLYVGGGIVADSDPAAEYEETLAKAAGILRGLGIRGAGPPATRAAAFV